ncbi:MAG: aminotransferase class I/II-fold pyridoxal phosphate-dependent enzyme [Gammaproteobacteria bacterium]|nr:aminotransferase class I/II-fold pyridoxal phosphate-dependent enzyme [Gammaproteobacteria bacterium]
MRFSALVERIAGEGADAWVTHYEARRAHERGENVILLSVGDPDFDTPQPVRERAIECIRAGDTHYTPASGRLPLREAIAALHSARSGCSVGADQVVVLAGAQNALFASSLCLAGPGDEVIAVEPMYPTYPATIEASGARMVRVPAPAANGFRIDLDALERAITPRTRALFFATPSNPTGVITSEAELARLGELARRHSLWIVADEVYAGLAPGGRVPSLAAAMSDRVITVGSLSKSHAMTGWRAGWIVGPREFAVHVESLVMCMLFGLPGFVQEAALTALGIAPAAEAQVRDYCGSRREFLLAQLQGAKGLHCFTPEAGMFMLIDVRATGLSGFQFMRGLYESEGVSVLDGGAFGTQTGGFVRVCFAAEEDVLREACVRIRRFAASLPANS